MTRRVRNDEKKTTRGIRLGDCTRTGTWAQRDENDTRNGRIRYRLSRGKEQNKTNPPPLNGSSAERVPCIFYRRSRERVELFSLVRRHRERDTSRPLRHLATPVPLGFRERSPSPRPAVSKPRRLDRNSPGTAVLFYVPPARRDRAALRCAVEIGARVCAPEYPVRSLVFYDTNTAMDRTTY